MEDESGRPGWRYCCSGCAGAGDLFLVPRESARVICRSSAGARTSSFLFGQLPEAVSPYPVSLEQSWAGTKLPNEILGWNKSLQMYLSMLKHGTKKERANPQTNEIAMQIDVLKGPTTPAWQERYHATSSVQRQGRERLWQERHCASSSQSNLLRDVVRPASRQGAPVTRKALRLLEPIWTLCSRVGSLSRFKTPSFIRLPPRHAPRFPLRPPGHGTNSKTLVVARNCSAIVPKVP